VLEPISRWEEGRPVQRRAEDRPWPIHKHQTVTVLVSETTLTVEFDDGDARVIRRTTTRPVRSIKGQRPWTAISVP
jgi:hypothetical protein